MHKVFFTDSSDRAALAVIRSLGRLGLYVIAAESTPFTTGSLSKYCRQRVIYPSPKCNKSRFISWIINFVKHQNVELIIPVSDYTTIPLAEYKDKIEHYCKIATPSYETVMKAADKIKTLSLAAKEKIPIPATYCLHEPYEIIKVAHQLKFPVVIKPRMKVYWVNDKALTFKITSRNYAYNEHDLRIKYVNFVKLLSKLRIKENFFFVQEFVKGQSYGVEALIYQGEPKAIFAHKRIREYPISGGASTLRESINDSYLTQLGLQALKAMGWEGVAMVEFKFENDTGEFKLLEVNGRFWGSLALAINAGVDFPSLLYRILIRGENVKSASYKYGLRQRWLLPGDILWLISSLLYSDRSKTKVLKEFIKSFNVKDDIISFEDFKPIFGTLLDMGRNMFEVLIGQRSIEGETKFKF